MDEVIRWWLDKAHKEIQRTVPKALEYGGKGAALDLVDIGRELGRLLGRPNMAEGEAQELGIWFYLRGKISRWSAAIMEGRRVSEDTLFDIGVYVRMVQRIRDVGAWPESTAKSRGVVE